MTEKPIDIEKSSTAKAIFEKGKAGYPALYLLSQEDAKSQGEIQLATKKLNRKLYIWTLGKGLQLDKLNSIPIADTELPNSVLSAIEALDVSKENATGAIFVLRLFHHHLEDPRTQVQILDLLQTFKVTQKMLIIVAPSIKLPPELEKEFTLIENQLPGKEQILEVLNGIIEGTNLEANLLPTEERKHELVEAALGLTTSEAGNALSLSIVRPRITKSNNIWDPAIVIEEKCAAIKKTGLLEYIPGTTEGLQQVGGLENLKEWIRKRKKAFSDEAKAFGLAPPSGILLVGPPGGGKSLSAKAISGELGIPLLRLDMGKMFGSLVGQSEANIRQAIQIAEAVAPCILWCDEVEKGLAGTNSSGSHDSGVGARVLGTVLTWMSEKKSSVFVFMTANNVTNLPPELMRKGRLDELWAVDLPNAKERKEILEIHITKRGRGELIKSGAIDIEHFSKEISEGFSGSEIESAIKEAMYSSFDAGKDLNTFDLMEAFDGTQPLSKMLPESIDSIRRWCKNRARPANSSPESNLPAVGNRTLMV